MKIKSIFGVTIRSMRKVFLPVFFILSIILFAACGQKEEVKPDDSTAPVEEDSGQTSDSSPSVKLLQIHEALFLSPSSVKNKGTDLTILQRLIDYLDYTPAKEKVHISIYQFKYPPLMEAISKAYKRGVEIHLMIDSGKEESWKTNAAAYKYFRNLIREAPSEYVVMKNDNTPTAINHQKYAAFSEVHLPEGVAKDLVLATSHNFMESSTKKIQDAIVMTNEPWYDAFVDNWQEAASRAEGGMKDYTYKEVTVGDSMTVCFFPRRVNGEWDGKDRILDELSKLGSDNNKDTVRVFMAFWSGIRSAISKKLIDLQDKGVTVQVITRQVGDGVSQLVMKDLKTIKENGGYVKILNISRQNLHSKCMLIKGNMDGEDREMILTGSHNYTAGALEYNNEVLMVLKNSILFKDYWQYFNRMQIILDDFSGWGD